MRKMIILLSLLVTLSSTDFGHYQKANSRDLLNSLFNKNILISDIVWPPPSTGEKSTLKRV